MILNRSYLKKSGPRLRISMFTILAISMRHTPYHRAAGRNKKEPPGTITGRVGCARFGFEGIKDYKVIAVILIASLSSKGKVKVILLGYIFPFSNSNCLIRIE